ncbi:MAG: gamma-glutamyltransferase [candidate division Zixibacteria bacterium]|nr:gamma-glutamyltransferase [candidate division Zixibacteria bacterium]
MNLRRALLVSSVILSLLGVTLTLLWVGCSGVAVKKMYTRGALSTVSPLATQVGERIFARGGNAIDVAVATAFALSVVYPPAGNIGGGGFALVRNGKTGEIVSLDFRETAPAAADEKMFLDSTGQVIPSASTLGAKAAGVPGTVAGLHALWKKYGSLPWSDLVAPAVQHAENGFVVNDKLAERFAEDSARLRHFDETTEIFAHSGFPRAGDTLVQKDLGRTLRMIGSDGPDAFYRGEIAERIVACMQQHGGLITADDLAGYVTEWRQPLRFTFDSLEVVSMGPPSSGGICLGQMLKLIEPYSFGRWSPSSPEYVHLVCEAARLSYADRATHLGDPAFYPVPDKLLDSAYLSSRRALIPKDRAGSSESVSAGYLSGRESSNTTHISVADAKGNVVVLTYTLNDTFGSCLVVRGTGFLLNNEMDDFSIKPGVPNIYGLIGGEANKIEPGKRMLSSMAPTIILKQGRPLLALGTPGGSKIITTIAETVLNITRFHLSPPDAVAHARFHHQWQPDVISFERGQHDYAPETKQALVQMGYRLDEKDPWGDVNLIAFEPSGVMLPVADWRYGGRAGGY